MHDTRNARPLDVYDALRALHNALWGREPSLNGNTNNPSDIAMFKIDQIARSLFAGIEGARVRTAYTERTREIAIEVRIGEDTWTTRIEVP